MLCRCSNATRRRRHARWCSRKATDARWCWMENRRCENGDINTRCTYSLTVARASGETVGHNACAHSCWELTLIRFLTGVAVPSLGCLSSVFSASGHLHWKSNHCRLVKTEAKLLRLQALSARSWLWFDFLARVALLHNSHCITRTVYRSTRLCSVWLEIPWIFSNYWNFWISIFPELASRCVVSCHGFLLSHTCKFTSLYQRNHPCVLQQEVCWSMWVWGRNMSVECKQFLQNIVNLRKLHNLRKFHFQHV